MILFFRVLSMVFLAEMGDKTQLFLVALTSKYKIRQIVSGVAAAVLTLNLAAVLAGILLGEFLPVPAIKLCAGMGFLAFALASLRESDTEACPKQKNRAGRSGILAVFLSFLLAELGDKTQLVVITFAADAAVSEAMPIFLAASIGQ